MPTVNKKNNIACNKLAPFVESELCDIAYQETVSGIKETKKLGLFKDAKRKIRKAKSNSGIDQNMLCTRSPIKYPVDYNSDEVMQNNIDPLHVQGSDFIPYSAHKVFVTTEKKRVALNDSLKRMFDKFLILLHESRYNWSVYFWHNSNTFIEENFYSPEYQNINFLHIESLMAFLKPSYRKALSSSLIMSKSLATDLLRWTILGERGGFYTDMDFDLVNTKGLDLLAKSVDFYIPVDFKNSWITNYFIASRAYHPIALMAATRYEEMILRNHESYITSCDVESEIFHINHESHITAIMDHYKMGGSIGLVPVELVTSKVVNIFSASDELVLYNRVPLIGLDYETGSWRGQSHSQSRIKELRRSLFYASNYVNFFASSTIGVLKQYYGSDSSSYYATNSIIAEDMYSVNHMNIDKMAKISRNIFVSYCNHLYELFPKQSSGQSIYIDNHLSLNEINQTNVLLDALIIPKCFVVKNLQCDHYTYFQHAYIRNAVTFLGLSNIKFLHSFENVETHKCYPEVFDTYYKALACVYDNLFQKDYYSIRSNALSVKSEYFTSEVKVPNVLHISYISNPIRPRTFSVLDQINLYNSSSKILADVYIWSNLDARALGIKDDFRSIDVRHVNELNLYQKFLPLFNEFMKKNLPVGVADLIKIIVLKQHGGMGVDGDIYFRHSPFILNSILDFYAGAHTNKTIGGGYIAAKSEHAIISRSLDIIASNYGLSSPSYKFKYIPKTLSCLGLIEYTLQGSIDIAYYLESNQNSNVDLLLNSVYLHDHYVANLDLDLSLNINGASLHLMEITSCQFWSASWNKGCARDNTITLERSDEIKISKVHDDVSDSDAISYLLEDNVPLIYNNSLHDVESHLYGTESYELNSYYGDSILYSFDGIETDINTNLGNDSEVASIAYLWS